MLVFHFSVFVRVCIMFVELKGRIELYFLRIFLVNFQWFKNILCYFFYNLPCEKNEMQKEKVETCVWKHHTIQRKHEMRIKTRQVLFKG